MTQPDDPGFLLWLLLLIPAGDLTATVFFGYLFWISKHEPVPGSDKTLTTPRFNHPLVRWIGRPLRFVFEGRSWLLALLATSFGIITVVFCWIGFLVARRFVGLPPLPSTVMVSITTPLIVLLGTIPIIFAIAFWLTRRTRGGPPPFGERD